jgi:hypothetical protein
MEDAQAVGRAAEHDECVGQPAVGEGGQYAQGDGATSRVLEEPELHSSRHHGGDRHREEAQRHR